MAKCCPLLFYQQLFTGKIVKDSVVLAEMYRDVPCKMKINYCLGVRKVSMAGATGYYHGGFFGTDVIYFPSLNASVAIVVLQKEERDISAEISKEVVRQLERH